MIVREDILFYMPRNREMQFPAMSAMQSYVNCYQGKMQANCVMREVPEFRFRYWCDMSEEDWKFWQDAGIELNQLREPIGYPDAVISLHDWRIEAFRNNEKHAAQICSAIVGVEGPPFPRIRKIKPDYGMGRIWSLGGIGGGSLITCDDLLSAADGQVGCVIGYQSWETYLAAAMGLPVIEILTKSRSLNWLSKWMNPLYRLVEEDHIELIDQALSNLREVLQCLLDQDHRPQVGQIPTAQ